MAFNFSHAASAAVSSPVMNNRTKLSMDDFIKRFPEGATLIQFDKLNGQNGEYVVFNILEDDAVFIPGGLSFINIANAWLSEFNGDIVNCNRELFASGGVKFKAYKEKTNKGNTLTKVEILESGNVISQ